MRKGLLALTAVAGLQASAQFGTAPDFTVTDLNSVQHNLYTWLNAGKVVIVDASATWCGPCWSLHQSHALRDLYNNYGPPGSDQLRVLFYEADASTTLADLQGNTGSTQGDWLTGTPYPVVNEAPLTLQGSVWWPQGFPTVSLIRPSDKEIVEDMWNFNYNQMVNAINQIITLNAVSVPETADADGVRLFPIPVADVLNVDLGSVQADELVVLDATGRVATRHGVNGETLTQLDVQALEAGHYLVSIRQNGQEVGSRRFVK